MSTNYTTTSAPPSNHTISIATNYSTTANSTTITGSGWLIVAAGDNSSTAIPEQQTSDTTIASTAKTDVATGIKTTGQEERRNESRQMAQEAENSTTWWVSGASQSEVGTSNTTASPIADGGVGDNSTGAQTQHSVELTPSTARDFLTSDQSVPTTSSSIVHNATRSLRILMLMTDRTTTSSQDLRNTSDALTSSTPYMLPTSTLVNSTTPPVNFSNGSDATEAQNTSAEQPTSYAVTTPSSTHTTAQTAAERLLQGNCSAVLETTPAPGPGVCSSALCNQQAQHMVSLMNLTLALDPRARCRRYYASACGGLQDNPLLQQADPLADAYRRISDVLASRKKLPVAIEKLRKFEQSCIQFGIQPPAEAVRYAAVRRVMESIGNFSFNNTEWENYRERFTDLFIMLLKYNSSPLFDVLLDVESAANPIFVFKLVPPLPDDQLFSANKEELNCTRIANQYDVTDMNVKYGLYESCKERVDNVIHIVQVVEQLGYLSGIDVNITENFKQRLEFGINDLNGYLKDVPLPSILRHEQLNKKYETITIAQMNKMFPLVDWKKLFSNLVEEFHEVNENHLVQVYSMEYFTFLFQDIADSSKGQQEFAKDLGNALLAYAANKFVNDFVELHNTCNREIYCKHVAYSLMPQAASSAYLRSFSVDNLEEMSKRATFLFSNLRDTLVNEFENTTWLDEESKIEMREHLQKIKLAPYEWNSFLLNDTYVDNYYEMIDIKSTDYFDNALSLVLLFKKKSYSLYMKGVLEPEHIWSHFMYPYHTNGNVIYALSTIVIPIGVLAKRSNHPSLPKYITMAGEGFIMAHELAHLFDFVGMKRSQDKAKNELKLSSHSSSIFQDMEKCLHITYDFQVSHQAEDGKYITFQTQGLFSANERMADSAGLMIAYHTYLRLWGKAEKLLPLFTDWTQDQLFYLHATQELCSKTKVYSHFKDIFEDVHLPPSVRVHNIVTSSEDFSKAYDCPATSVCEVFPRLRNVDDFIPGN